MEFLGGVAVGGLLGAALGALGAWAFLTLRNLRGCVPPYYDDPSTVLPPRTHDTSTMWGDD